MISQFDNELFSSFKLWFENKLLVDAFKAYVTGQSNTFEYVDFPDMPSSFLGYQGKYRQLVADHSVDVPNSGIFVGGTFVSGDSPDIYIDYNDGRVIFPLASGTGLTVTANSTVREINVYPIGDDDEVSLLQNDFISSSSPLSTHLFSKENKRDENTYIIPACFLKLETSENDEFAFGGEYETINRIRAIVLTEDNYTMDALLGYFRDQIEECIKRVPYESDPFGQSHTLKSYPYTYSEFVDAYTAKTFVSEVAISKVTKSLSLEKIQKNVKLGYIDFVLSTYRYPKL